jgi:hypothetical protein
VVGAEDADGLALDHPPEILRRHPWCSQL